MALLAFARDSGNPTCCFEPYATWWSGSWHCLTLARALQYRQPPNIAMKTASCQRTYRMACPAQVLRGCLVQSTRSHCVKEYVFNEGLKHNRSVVQLKASASQQKDARTLLLVACLAAFVLADTLSLWKSLPRNHMLRPFAP